MEGIFSFWLTTPRLDASLSRLKFPEVAFWVLREFMLPDAVITR